MKRETDLRQNLAMAVVIGLFLLVTGCDKQTSTGETVGQKVDKVIDKTNETAQKAGDKIGTAAKSAEEAVKSAAETAQQKAGQVGAMLDDAAITASIKTELLKDPGTSALRIDVNTLKGEVTLKGEADNDSARARAGRIAATVEGVVKVNNSINIKG
jgi:hyperosmotically inducible periplasmic protein